MKIMPVRESDEGRDGFEEEKVMEYRSKRGRVKGDVKKRKEITCIE